MSRPTDRAARTARLGASALGGVTIVAAYSALGCPQGRWQRAGRGRHKSFIAGTIGGARRLLQSGFARHQHESVRRPPMATATSDRDPRHHTQNMQRRLQETMDHLRQDIGKVDEPQLKAMFETAAEVLGGLKKAFHDYEQKKEKAWQP